MWQRKRELSELSWISIKTWGWFPWHPLLRCKGYTCMILCRYAKEILQKEMLPHVGVGEYCETKKAYYFGYVYSFSDPVFSFSWLSEYLLLYYHYPTDISFTGYCCVHLGGGLRMIGIIMETRGWIWLVLYLVVFSEWFVYDITQFHLSFYIVTFWLVNSWLL